MRNLLTGSASLWRWTRQVGENCTSFEINIVHIHIYCVNIVHIYIMTLESCNHSDFYFLWHENWIVFFSLGHKYQIQVNLKCLYTILCSLMCSFSVWESVRVQELHYKSIYVCVNGTVQASPAACQAQCVGSGCHHMLQPGARVLDPASLAWLSRGIHLHHSLDWRKLISLENFW